ncbi:tetratricopeptide repeat protein, partial [Streptomyces sp. SBT349]|uniref:tetratricopeptide repeat protein n=1 Tax=Streptomyces sp. SBT349 TaxID=1580539 RepID=UPI00066E09F3
MNRADSFAALDAALDAASADGTPALTLISGPPGVGKTSLALSWMHGRAAGFPDGQLYVDLRGHQVEEPMGASTVLPKFLQALGVPPEQVPSDLPGQAALYRTVTADRRIAVLCDNALSAAQVRPLMPASPGSLCVVTSRWRLTSLLLDGAEMVQLGPLDTESSLELLGRIAGRDRVAADAAAAMELVRSCGRFPLALCVGAALLAIRPGWSVAAAAASFVVDLPIDRTNTDEEAVSMDACLDQVHAALPAEAKRLYRRLGLHPGPEFDAGVADAVAPTAPEVPDPARGLATLAEANLLTVVGPGRYKFHDLIHRHARERAEADDGHEQRGETVQRVIDHYLATANAADRVVYPQRRRPDVAYTHEPPNPRAFGDLAAGLAWLDAEHDNLMAVQRLAASLGNATATWQLAEALWGLFTYMRYHEDWIASHEAGADAARACGHPVAEARLRNGLGVALREAGRHQDALRVFDEALALRRETGDRRGEALVLHNVGLTHGELGDLARAGELFRTALGIRDREGDARGAARERSALGEVESLQGRHAEAIALLTEALSAVRGTGDPYYEALIWRRLGQARLRAGDRPAARRAL